jgi:glycosyltransferase involved in cell wall biosynthesis
MNWVVGSMPYHRHIQNVVLAILEAGCLKEWHTAMVDFESDRDCGPLLAIGKKLFPALRQNLSRRRIEFVPREKVVQHPGWELLRVATARLGLGTLTSDWCWEREEWAMDKVLKRCIQQPDVDGIFGVEHGCLAAIREANRLGKWSGVAFTSLHHAFVEKWVTPELEKFPELATPESRKLDALARERDRRRDQEAAEARIIHTNSDLTKQTLIQAGFPADKFIKVPLASRDPLPYAECDLRAKRLRILMCGAVSVRKGTHLLLRAWKEGGFSRYADLELFGGIYFSQPYLHQFSHLAVIHGLRPRAEIDEMYKKSHVMIFPTLADGFGGVVMESMAMGCPVLCSANAGASEMIRHNENGRIFAPASVEAIRDEIQWCLDNRKKLQEMRHAAYFTAKNWTWDKFRELFRQQFLLLTRGG